MTEDQHIAQAAARAAIAYRNGDYLLGAYWEERAERLSDAREWADMKVHTITVSAEEFARLENRLDEEPKPVPGLIELVRKVREQEAHCATFDELKGSPDHSVVRHG